MSKPVDKEHFWKWRLKEARELRHSVYLTSETDWNHITAAHKVILQPYKDKKVLDAGCGYGRWSEFFSNYVGIDLSPDFIDKAKELYPEKEFITGRLEKLPYKDNEFDMAFCVSVKNMIVGQLGESAWEKIEKELMRVSKELILLEYTNPSEYDVLR